MKNIHFFYLYQIDCSYLQRYVKRFLSANLIELIEKNFIILKECFEKHKRIQNT